MLANSNGSTIIMPPSQIALTVNRLVRKKSLKPQLTDLLHNGTNTLELQRVKHANTLSVHAGHPANRNASRRC